jgi:hypothetical protein
VKSGKVKETLVCSVTCSTMWSRPPWRSHQGKWERIQACASMSMLTAPCTRGMSARLGATDRERVDGGETRESHT